jgi:hypothetical protein
MYCTMYHSTVSTCFPPANLPTCQPAKYAEHKLNRTSISAGGFGGRASASLTPVATCNVGSICEILRVCLAVENEGGKGPGRFGELPTVN